MENSAQSSISIGPAAANVVVDGGRNDHGLPIYWRWDPTQVDDALRNKLNERATRGCTNPPLIPLPERISALDALEAIDETLTGAGTAHVWPPSDEVIAMRKWRGELDTVVSGTGHPNTARRFARGVASAFDVRSMVTMGTLAGPSVLVIGLALGVLAMLVIPGPPAAGLLVAAAATAIGACAAPAARRWAATDSLAFTPADHAAITAAYVEVTVHADGSPEYDLARRAATACDDIAASRAFRDSHYLDEHRALLDPAIELRDMITHAHHIATIRQQLGSGPQGDDVDAVLAREVFHRHDLVMAASVDELRSRVTVVESYASHLAELGRQLDNQDALQRSDSAAGAVDALHRYDASDHLAAETVRHLDSDLPACTAAITAHLDALRGDLEGLDRLLARNDEAES